MVEPPTGTLTFLFTDIEGSTGRWEAQSAEMADALTRHDAVLRAAIESHGGFLLKHTGDGVLAAFASASAAVTAAIEAQRALELPVRMGLATGEATYRDGDYFGPTLNRAARVMAAGHGGQVLLANSTAAVVSGFDLLDLGEHRLRDLPQREHLSQLRADGLRTQFPPLRTLDTVPGNLPLQTTSFVGREEEVTKLVAVLRDHRLVTLTGVGGVGKTRLALEVAADLAGEYEGGAWLVELAAVSELAAVGHAIAATLAIAPQPNVTIEESVVRALTGRNVLVILDNCEHLIDAIAALAEEILRHCPDVTVLATSREALRVEGEQAWPVPSLGVHDGAGSAAVTLFAERARAVDPAFDLAADAHAVVEICRRLDGIPLAIELAAARLRAMSPAQIRDRLDERFRLLTGGSRRALERHQTLRHAVQWSFDLLTDPERALLRRASVFAGGFSLDAAERVCSGDGVDSLDVLDLLDSLVRKSLVTTERAGDDVRYGLLETVRQFGEEQLAAAGEVESRRTLHALYFAEAAAANWDRWCSPRQREANEWLGRETDNLRTAFRWSRESGDIATAAGIACDSYAATLVQSTFEPVSWAIEAVAPARASGLASLADLLGVASWCLVVGAMDECLRFADEAIDLVVRGGARVRSTLPWYNKGAALWIQWRNEEALEVSRQGMERAEDARLLMCRTLHAQVLGWSGRGAEATNEASEVVRLASAEGIPFVVSAALGLRSEVRLGSGEVSQATDDALRGMRIAEDAGLRLPADIHRRHAAMGKLLGGDIAGALRMYLETLESLRSLGEWINSRAVLLALAGYVFPLGSPRASAMLSRLIPGTDAVANEAGPGPSPSMAADRIAEGLARARAKLGDSEFERLAAEGAAMPFVDLVRYAEGEVRAILAFLEARGPARAES